MVDGAGLDFDGHGVWILGNVMGMFEPCILKRERSSENLKANQNLLPVFRRPFIAKDRENLFIVLSFRNKVVVKQIVLLYFFPFVLLSQQIKFFVADFGFAHMQQAHDLVLLVVRHLLPKMPFFAATQAAFAIAFFVGFAYADAGAGDGKEIGLFHDEGAQRSSERV